MGRCLLCGLLAGKPLELSTRRSAMLGTGRGYSAWKCKEVHFCVLLRHVGVVHDGAPGRKIPVGGDGRCANALPRPNRPLLSCRLTVSGKHGQVTFAFKACDSRRSFRKVAQSAARPVASSCGACPVFDKGCSSRVPRSHLHPIAYHPYSYLQSEEL
jgi:hypothetical protein